MTDPATALAAFLAAESALDQARDAWNALPTPETRQASGIDINRLDEAQTDAARTLLAAAGDFHKIEEQSRVWLILDGGRWAIDPANEPGFEGYENGANNDACGCVEDLDGEEADRTRAECDAVARAANTLDPLSPRQLRDLLNAYLADNPDPAPVTVIPDSELTKAEKDAIDLDTVRTLVHGHCPTAVAITLETSDQGHYGFVLTGIVYPDGDTVTPENSALTNDAEDQIAELLQDIDWNGVVGESPQGYARVEIPGASA